MLLDTNKSVLVVIDVQAKLLPGVHEQQRLVDNCKWLTRLAQLMAVPVIGSEQYPQGLGHTEEGLRELIGADRLYGKAHFACIDDPDFGNAFRKLDRKQAVLCGMESHACVIQSALRLLEEGYEVFVIADSISARNPLDTEVALRRMEKEGVRLLTREMAGFEWVRSSDAPQFKAFSMEFLR
ncbi:hydrolase [Marinobacterium marinum]|uniref:Hydrolase n=1 Tax=Marinobacterium marinum TaxID=2756129 RepID=A0A7W1X002_9GAMM|nr:hydrolase [Marinobacterium marinum]MBA4503269.1 hydrolase [Marinobacterium marinum]